MTRTKCVSDADASANFVIRRLILHLALIHCRLGAFNATLQLLRIHESIVVCTIL